MTTDVPAPDVPAPDLSTLLDAWAAAEVSSDPAGLEPLLAEDFTAVGPLGFVLDRDAFLARHGTGLDYSSFAVDERAVRQEGDTALVTARLSTVGSYRGTPVPEALRATVVLSRHAERWRMLRVHMSFVAGTAGAPPLPGRP